MVTRLQRPRPYAGCGRSGAVPWEWKRRQTQRHQSKSQVQGRVGCLVAQMWCLRSPVAFGDLVMLEVFFSFKRTEMKLLHRGKN
jgi:hypothetical protein